MTQHLIFATLAAAMMLPSAARPLAAQFPTTPPPAAPLRPLDLPPFEEATLANGLQLLVVPNRELPIVSIQLAIRAGDSFDPTGKEGLASLVASVLSKGTATRTAEQIAGTIEGVGASLNAGSGTDVLTVATTVLKQDLDTGFELVADVLLHPSFPEQEVELARTQTLSGIQFQESQPAFLAGKYFAQRLYGEHPYGRTATSASVGAVTREDVVAFAQRHLRPSGSLLIIAGDITLAEARRAAERYLSGWTGTGPAFASYDTPAPMSTEILLVHRPGSQQSNILVGNLTMRPGDPDYYAAVLANRVLGGGSDARLFLILRQDKGWTYGAYSSHNRPQDVARFQASTEVRTEVTDSALVEILIQLERMRSQPVLDDELVAAKGFLVGSFPLSIETPQQVAAQVRTVKLLGLGDDYLQAYRARLSAITAQDILAVSNRIMMPESSVIVVVGDGRAIHEKLTAIAPVTIIDPAGNTLTPDALNPTAEAITFDPNGINIGRDSMVVLVQGQPFGAVIQTTEEVVVDGRPAWRFERDINIAPFLTQTTTLLVDRTTMRPISLDQTAQQQGQPLEVHFQYGPDGSVSGTASSPDGEVVVDTVLGANVLDNSMVQAMIGALPFSDGASHTVAVFTSEGTVSQISVTVADAGTITVPAGDFPAWRVEASGTDAPTTFWVSQNAPRRLLKLAIAGQPITFELAGTN